MKVNGVLTQNVELELPIELGIPVEKPFTTTDESIEIEITKGYKPRIHIWTAIPDGHSLELLPTKIISGELKDTLIVSNFNGNEGIIIIN